MIKKSDRIIRLPRKYKKKLKKIIGFGSYNAIVEGNLYIQNLNKGFILKYSKYYLNKIYNENYENYYYIDGCYNPYITLKKVKYPFNINNLRETKIKKIINIYERNRICK